MAHFDDVILPRSYSRGSNTGPQTSTDLVYMASGYRKANRRWAQHLRRFDIGYNVRTPADAHVILNIFEAVEGPGNSFLIRDWNDWNTTANQDEESGAAITSSDQPTSDLGNDRYQLIKVYSSGSASHTRNIIKPANDGSLKVIGGTGDLSEGVDFTVGYATGIITLTGSPTPAGSPSPLRWGGKFHVPVAFVSDGFVQQLTTYKGSAVPNIELLEVRL